MQISRRNALTGATAAIAVAAIPTTVQANDAHIEALHADWRAADAAWSVVNRVADKTLIDALLSCGPYPADVAAADAWGDARSAAKKRPNIVALQRREEAARHARDAAFNRFMDAPAYTPRGVLLKLEAGIREEQLGDSGPDENSVVAAIRRDLERLAGGARL